MPEPAKVLQADFDAIVSVAALHHLSLEDVLPRLVAALRPGVRLAVLDLFESAGWQDRLLDGLAIPVSAGLRLVMNGRLRRSATVQAAWADHGRHDSYLRVADVRRICAMLLPGAIVRRHLLGRYSLVWQRPAAEPD